MCDLRPDKAPRPGVSLARAENGTPYSIILRSLENGALTLMHTMVSGVYRKPVCNPA